MIVGHTEALASIPDLLPPVLLLTGPEGVGKRKIAHTLAERFDANDIDRQVIDRLDKDAARSVVAHHTIHPVSSQYRITLADLSTARPDAQHVLLKVLENPPAHSRFVLHSDRAPLLTLRSRCFNVRFGVLSVEDVKQVLDRLHIEGAEQAAQASQGRVSLAIEYSYHREARSHVAAILEALAGNNDAVIEESLRVATASIKGEQWQTDKRREMVCLLLARVLRQSLGRPFPVEPERCVVALKILENPSRPALRLRAAVWAMA